MFEEKMSSRGKDQCLDLREFDAFERALGWGTTVLVTLEPYLQSVEIREGL